MLNRAQGPFLELPTSLSSPPLLLHFLCQCQALLHSTRAAHNHHKSICQIELKKYFESTLYLYVVLYFPRPKSNTETLSPGTQYGPPNSNKHTNKTSEKRVPPASRYYFVININHNHESSSAAVEIISTPHGACQNHVTIVAGATANIWQATMSNVNKTNCLIHIDIAIE